MQLKKLITFITLLSTFALTPSFAANPTLPGLTFSIIKSTFRLDAKAIKNVSVIKKSNNHNSLQIELTPQAAKQFYQLTKSNVGKHIVILMNDQIITAATMQSPLGARFTISNITDKQVRNFMTSYIVEERALNVATPTKPTVKHKATSP